MISGEKFILVNLRQSSTLCEIISNILDIFRLVFVCYLPKAVPNT